LQGTDIYAIAGPHGWQYIYPPPFAVAMVPLAWMSLFWAVLVWFALSALMTIWAVHMCVAITKEGLPFVKDVFWLYALPSLMLLGWWISAITRGQASVPMFWLVVAAILMAMAAVMWAVGRRASPRDELLLLSAVLKLETYGLPCWAALGVWGALVAAAERRVQCP
jgi:hypothetical protein